MRHLLDKHVSGALTWKQRKGRKDVTTASNHGQQYSCCTDNTNNTFSPSPPPSPPQPPEHTHTAWNQLPPEAAVFILGTFISMASSNPLYDPPHPPITPFSFFSFFFFSLFSLLVVVTAASQWHWQTPENNSHCQMINQWSLLEEEWNMMKHATFYNDKLWITTFNKTNF